MKIGIVGLPNVGKSTLFNALTKGGAEAANYPFCTIEPNVGIVAVPDDRLGALADISGSKKIIPTTIEFVDIAGLVAGASRGEGLGNLFLSHIRSVDAIAHVVRCFADDNITHVHGGLDPVSDARTINLELILADLELVEKKLETEGRKAKSGDKQAKVRLSGLQKLQQSLEQEQPARHCKLTPEEKTLLRRDCQFLTDKKVIYVANVDEADLPDGDDNSYVSSLRSYALSQGDQLVCVSARVEAELAELDEDESAIFLQELGIEQSGFKRLINAAYSLLDLISFLTTGKIETRAWTIRRGTLAPQAAAVIHTDFEKHFIRAEVVPFDDLISAGSWNGARQQGKLRTEGKNYVLGDGEVTHFLTSA
ncbi:redox-regulated ATPase YchF [Desulforhopalus singaporensis]|uniref:Ribosome-binding ATPase YchF n=1 Tax=Desulforhopalus singaporensis TaxID=91360 RepID=A0A1H0UBE5_9BACT|nr:redox-regulated ATPase YchF [Desulforhopalus singaporensis]SDP63451.1 hypothetical protein SAMN05660330_03474 [Desulforhopalus singaporensis]